MATLLFFLRDALVAQRFEFPPDCEIHVRRGDAGGIELQGAGTRFEVIVGSRTISERHCVIRVCNGLARVEDLESRNGSMLRIAPGESVPLEGRALHLGSELIVREDEGRWQFPDEGLARGADALCAWMNGHLSGTGLRAELASPAAGSLPLTGEEQHLNLRADFGTVDAEHAQWARWCVSRRNTAFAEAARSDPWAFLATSTERRRALDQAQRAAPTALPILIVGPTGVGKDLLAQEIHEHSPRRAGPFVRLKCARASTLADCVPFLESAQGGTLFLDDPTAIPASVQSGFAPLLDDDLRVVAATSADPGDPLVMRPELYYRLAGVRIDVPSLGREDAAAIADEMLAAASPEARARILADVASAAWPGGVRELRQRIERTLQLHRGDEGLWEAWQAERGATPSSVPSLPPPAAKDPRVMPASLARLTAELAFLLAARTAPNRRTLARRTQMTYQGAAQRLTGLKVALGDSASIEARFQDTLGALRAQLRQAPTLASTLRTILEE